MVSSGGGDITPRTGYVRTSFPSSSAARGTMLYPSPNHKRTLQLFQSNKQEVDGEEDDAKRQHQISPHQIKRKSMVMTNNIPPSHQLSSSEPSKLMLLGPELRDHSVTSSSSSPLSVHEEFQPQPLARSRTIVAYHLADELNDNDTDVDKEKSKKKDAAMMMKKQQLTAVLVEAAAASSSSSSSQAMIPSKRDSTGSDSTTLQQHPGGLGGERRLSITFFSYGNKTDVAIPQTFGKYGWSIPDGLSGNHTMYAQPWKFEIVHGTCMGGTVLCWKITNLISNGLVSVTETPQQATLRQSKGNTICNLVLRKALNQRAAELEQTIAQGDKNPTQVANLRSLIKELRPKQCTEGLLFFGLRHESVQLQNH